ncbi:hypothetical protein D051_0265 [Vibrio parahaemolyticus VPCR-2010]|uniref:hypothetical protein n=1 Tax=Vibrio parahaemolyticus TaxID=670 RepID=UPI00038E6367|nr:hypothetical protein D051_0265 [Vibrio parahaemolyticus VPCR-2010]
MDKLKNKINESQKSFSILLSWSGKNGKEIDLDLSLGFVNGLNERAMQKVYFGHEGSIGVNYHGDSKGDVQNDCGLSTERISFSPSKLPINVKSSFVVITNNDIKELFSELEKCDLCIKDDDSDDVLFALNLLEVDGFTESSAFSPLKINFGENDWTVKESKISLENTYLDDVHNQYFNVLKCLNQDNSNTN